MLKRVALLREDAGAACAWSEALTHAEQPRRKDGEHTWGKESWGDEKCRPLLLLSLWPLWPIMKMRCLCNHERESCACRIGRLDCVWPREALLVLTMPCVAADFRFITGTRRSTSGGERLLLLPCIVSQSALVSWCAAFACRDVGFEDRRALSGRRAGTTSRSADREQATKGGASFSSQPTPDRYCGLQTGQARCEAKR